MVQQANFVPGVAMGFAGTQTSFAAFVHVETPSAPASSPSAAFGAQSPSLPQHLPNVMGAPVAFWSQPSPQIPVSVPFAGLKQGAQRSFAAHVSWGRYEAKPARAPMHVEAQRPSPPPIEAHVLSWRFSPCATMLSGTQAPLPLSHGASSPTTPLVTRFLGTQREPAQGHAG
jgi:hypothetical protein